MNILLKTYSCFFSLLLLTIKERKGVEIAQLIKFLEDMTVPLEDNYSQQDNNGVNTSEKFKKNPTEHTAATQTIVPTMVQNAVFLQ